MENPGSRIAICARTFGDGRDTCVEGESGLLAVLPPSVVSKWNRSLGEVVLNNGTLYRIYGSEAPDRLRGPQHHRAWCDELAAWDDFEMWDNLIFGLRLGTDPRIVVSTTPQPKVLVKELVERIGRDVVASVGSTYENADNLPAATLARLREKYEGTRLGAQELHAKLLLDTPGALWTYESITRVRETPDLDRVLVAVDPAVTSNESSAETGIMVGGRASRRNTLGRLERTGYLLADGSLKGTPHEWASRAVALYRKFNADAIVAEVNNGGDLVEHTIHTIDPHIKVVKVRATRGKLTRAEPVSALYEQRRVFHVGPHRKVEDQMCAYDGSGPSPDRMDALVWLFTELLVEGTVEHRPAAPSAVDSVSPYAY
jgi:phage terminase large subunit-like protein